MLSITHSIISVLSEIKNKIKKNSPYDIEIILRSQKYMDHAKLIDRLFRYQKVISNQVHWNEINFEGKTVLEIGSGPLLGWGPIAVFLGNNKYVCVEPAYNPAVLDSQEIWNRYFFYLYKQLKAIFGDRMSLSEFKNKVLNNISCYTTYFQEVDFMPESFDLVLSNSVFEHIVDFDEFFKKLKLACKPFCIHMHAVDFGNHRANNTPFSKMYLYSPEEYFKRHSRFINLRKPSELVQIWKQYGFDIQLVPYVRVEELLPQNVNHYWKRFPTEELSIKVAFFVSKM